MIGFARAAAVVAGKDLVLEMRSRERLVSMLTFAVLVAVVFNFSLDPTAGETPVSAMLWVTILFSGMLGLGRSFSLEKEQDALIGILLSPIDRGAIFFGKFVANLAILLVTVVAIYLAYGLFFGVSFLDEAAALALVTVLACVGFMALGTLFSAVAASTRLGDTLLPIVLLPLLAPVVIFAAAATQRLLTGLALADIASSIRMLGAFDIIFVIVCTLIFGSVVEE